MSGKSTSSRDAPAFPAGDVAWSDVAPRAYEIADAMLAERAKEAS